MKRFTSLKWLWASMAALSMVCAGLPASADQSEASAYDLPFYGEMVYEVTCDSLTVHVPEMSGDLRDEELGRYEYWLGEVQADSLFYAEVTPFYVGPDPWGAELDVPYELEAGTYRLELDLYASDGFHETVAGDEIVITGCEEEPEPPVNNPPVVDDLSLTTVQDVAVSGTVNAYDPDGDDLSYVFGEASNGAVTNMGVSFTYTPNSGWFGTDSFEITASDGELEAVGTVTVQVTEAEEPPPVEPAGTSVYDTSQCELIVIGTPTGIQPKGADWQYLIDSEMIGVGEYDHLNPGQEYLLELDVNGVTVDSDLVVVTECDGDDPEPPVPPAPPVVDFLRWSGPDRYGTAAQIALNGNWAPGGTVYVATGQDMPDALSLSGASVSFGAATNATGVTVDGPPVLLVKQDAVPQATRSALDQLSPSRIVVAGSSAAVSSEVERQLGAWAPVDRLGGANRYETAAKVATQTEHEVVYLASGEVFADALTAAPLSRWTGGAILLAKQGNLPSVTGDALATLQPARLVVVGGSDRVSDSVAQAAAEAAGLTGFERLAGADRYKTSQVVAKAFPEDVPTSTLMLATGVDYPDALTAGAYAGNQGAPVLLTRPNSLPKGTAEAAQHRPALEQVILTGGENAVSAAVFDNLPSLFE